MNLIKKIHNWIDHTIFYYDVNEDFTRKEKELKVNVNQYSFIVFIILLLQTGFDLYNFGFVPVTIFIGILAIVFALSPFIFKKFRTKKAVIATFLIFITLVIHFFSKYCGLNTGIYLYYLPLFISIPILFSVKEDIRVVTFLSLFIIINIYATVGLDFIIIEKNPIYIGHEKSLLILNITCILLMKVMMFYFLEEKRENFYILEHRNILKKEEISNLKNEVSRLNELLNKNDISEEYLQELIDCISLSDTVFIDKFEILYPGFFQRLKEIANAPLSLSDLKFSALLKLGYTTKQIAIYTESTIKAVESKKYRLRKKLNIPTNNDSTIWFHDL